MVTVKGPKGALSQRLSPRMRLQKDNGTIVVERPDNQREHRSLHGLTRTLLNNMVVGVTDGYKRDLEIQGVGYRAALEGRDLVLSVGFSHPVRMTPPEGVSYALDGNTRLSVIGIDKQLIPNSVINSPIQTSSMVPAVMVSNVARVGRIVSGLPKPNPSIRGSPSGPVC